MSLKSTVLLGIAAVAVVMVSSSCVPPPPPGRVILAAPRPHVGYWVYGRHGRRYFVSRPWVRPAPGVYVEYLPEGYNTVIVGGVPYYYFNGSYFRPYSSGYVVVDVPDQNSAQTNQPPPPAPAPQANQQIQSPAASGNQGTSLSSTPASDTVTVSVPNAKGGYTAVKLVKRDGGYIGPQGEYYSGHPTVDQLKALYGN